MSKINNTPINCDTFCKENSKVYCDSTIRGDHTGSVVREKASLKNRDPKDET